MLNVTETDIPGGEDIMRQNAQKWEIKLTGQLHQLLNNGQVKNSL